LSTNIWERGHPACPNASETLTFPVHAQLSQDCYNRACSWYLAKPVLLFHEGKQKKEFAGVIIKR
jgi:hypothetical protein